ncbi:MAG: DUF262 domain-containing protein, partial [Methanothrix sp.]|nr:DUF262 domain-containing protein [Methanothrix sp.]
MLKNDRDIGTEDFKIVELVKMLQEDKFLIPTFQREFVWEPSNIIKLWDSIYKFYPIGSILYWETDSFLHTHRKLGGFVFSHDEDTIRKFKEWKYILDGQQRATALLVSLLGGKGRVEDDYEFDYTLYFDATDANFFFSNELDKRKEKDYDERFLIKVRDVPNWHFAFYKEISDIKGFNEKIEYNLQQLSRIFKDYKIPIVRIKGVEISEVCEIFERINQEGKRLHPVDIIVARTYRNEDLSTGYKGFYLRDNLNALKDIITQQGSRFHEIDDLLIIQMVALCLRKEHTGSRNPFGITPSALDNLTTDIFEDSWDQCQKTILETIKFLTDLKIHGPEMLPFSYYALPICYYLHRNRNPNYDIVRQWFWVTAFGADEFRSSTNVYDSCEGFFNNLRQDQMKTLPQLVISKTKLIQTNYNYRNALSRAVLAFMANLNPLDFGDLHAVVLDNVYLLLSHAPNLHRIYPQNFLKTAFKHPQAVSPDSLMNICIIRARTNTSISDNNPLVYFKD